MKKFLAIALIFVMAVALLALCACHEHEFGEWKTTLEPTCTANGEKQRECDCSEKQTETIPATGHTEGDWVIDVEPTYTTVGSKHQNCSVCGVLLKTETIPLIDHKKEAVVTEPTCTAEGYTTYYCSCGVNYIGAITPALGHDLVDHEGQAPTCTQIGWDDYVTCSRCDYSTYNELPKTAHQYGSWWEVTPATCTQAGLEQRFCACSARDTRDIQPLGHAYNSNKVCSRCGDVDYSQGLEYTLINDGKEAAVSGIGSCKDSHVIVSPTYNGVPVTTVALEAFRGVKTVTKITLPNTITKIESYAFYECQYLQDIQMQEGVKTIGAFVFGKTYLDSITIPNSVTKIAKSALSNCTSLDELTLPFVGETPDGETNNHFGWIFGANNYMGNINVVPTSLQEVTITNCTTIARGAFFDCDHIFCLTLPSTITSIGNIAFYGCTNLQSIVIPSGVTTIGGQTFQGCAELKTITLPISVTTVADYAFSGCTKIQHIFYAGSQQDWNKISIGSNNGYFSVDAVTFNYTVA